MTYAKFNSQLSDILHYLSMNTLSIKVPRVFIHGNFIGGGTEVQQLQKNGKLAEIVNVS